MPAPRSASATLGSSASGISAVSARRGGVALASTRRPSSTPAPTTHSQAVSTAAPDELVSH